MSECTHNCESCGENCSQRSAIQKEKPHQLSKIKKVIGIVSGKGGVGKSLVTSLSAVLSQRNGYKTAILDADITGPSIPKMFGVSKRLDGDEIGLIAYYPFEYYKEWQGSTELDYTLQDQKIPTDPTQTAPLAIVEGAAIETMETAPILNQGPVSELMFNYVVNNDALIITLDEPSESIEKTIVTFVADGILDQNGNEIISIRMYK